MIGFVISALKIIFLLGFLIFIHEGGHFLVAKLCKVRVNEFAIGFGPTIWKKQGKETKYALRLIPLGGFVSMEGEEERSEKEGSFSKTSIPKRIAIVAAGATVNIIFAMIVYFILAVNQGNYISNKVSTITPNYAAEKYGLQEQDEIIKINNKRIRLKSDLDKYISKSKGKEIIVTVRRNNTEMDINIVPTKIESKSTGIYFGAKGENLTTELVAIYPNSPAQKVGLKVKDKIIKVNGIDVQENPYKVVELIQQTDESKIEFTIDRKGEELIFNVIPEIVSNYYLGVELMTAENTLANNIYYAFWDTLEFSTSIIDNLKLLFTGKVQINQFMGPIGISETVAKTEGIRDFVYLMALISLSLGVTNLLPIPALDGGKIVILVIEAIRRKPLKQELEIGIQMAGFMFLIGLSIYISYQDILRIF